MQGVRIKLERFLLERVVYGQWGEGDNERKSRPTDDGAGGLLASTCSPRLLAWPSRNKKKDKGAGI